LIGETLGRYFGLSADLIRERQRELRNPLVWFREGVRALLLWPVQLLESLGLGSGSRTASLARSSAFQTISGAVAVISFVASVIEILLGWEQTVDAVRGLLGR
jgi:hypothetical protein